MPDQKFIDRVQSGSVILLVSSIVGLAAVVWNHEVRLPNQIPPAWFENQVNGLEDRIEALEKNQSRVEKIEADIEHFEQRLRELQAKK